METIIVTIEGGVVQSVITEKDYTIVVIDYDTQQIPKGKLTGIPDNFYGSRYAYVYPGFIQDTNPERINEIITALKQ